MKPFFKAVVENTAPYNRISEPVILAVPFPRGMAKDPAVLTVEESGCGTALPSDIAITGRWHDGTIRWAVFTVLCSIGAGRSIELSVGEKVDGAPPESISSDVPFQFVAAKAGIAKNEIGHIAEGGQRRAITLRCFDNDHRPVDFTLLSATAETTPIKKVSTLAFRGEVPGNPHVECIIRVYDFFSAGIVRMDATIRNRNAAKHAGGCWDLGDPGSFVFSELSIETALLKPDRCGYALDSTAIGTSGFDTRPFSLLQQSSGGVNWNGRNHVAAGDVSFRVKKGAVVRAGESIAEYDRITPSVFIGGADGALAVTLAEFWENFPSSLEVTGEAQRCVVGLFPFQNGERYELQGGEQKKHSVFFRRFGAAQPGSMQWAHDPLLPVIPREWYERCGVYPYLTTPAASDPLGYVTLVNQCVDERTGFAARREIIDEYGWRNFGELFADHESAYLDNGSYFVSHYNNQYDFAYYALVHFWRSGDRRWYRCADQLARHVRDIDIYHTAKDRSVFNGGIFWHTNHYTGAETATHRCYTAKGTAPAAGGISVQNCYCEGLIAYFQVTADPDMKESLFEIMEYVRKLAAGPDGFFRKTLYFLNDFLKNSYYRLRSLATKQLFPHTMFLGPCRESGNALLALVRFHEFTGDPKYLAAAERLIGICISPLHDLFKRKMDEPEYRWTYLLFLQSLVAYLALKEQQDRRDPLYRYALQSFMHYLRWMADNEYPYLEKPHKLEFANETWAMQELRKSHLFYEAADRAATPEERNLYIEKAEYFEQQAYRQFNHYRRGRFLTRPLVLAAAYGLIPHYFRNRGVAHNV